MSGKFQRMIFGCLFLAVFMFAGFYGTRFAFFVLSPVQGPALQETVIEVQKGQGPKELTRVLISEGILKAGDEENFLLFGRVSRLWGKVKAGEYKFSTRMTPMEVFRVLTSGVSILHPLTVREGDNMYEIGAALEEQGLAKKETFVALCRDAKMIAALGLNPKPQTLEGYLFPDTYFLNKTMTAEDIIRGMVRKFNSVWRPEHEARAKELGLTRHETITLASIIEKETGAPHERPMISSVFHNRLKKKMRLQSDPTTIYGMWERYKGNITKSDLVTGNPYNTYHVPALPIGPISNPGREAIQAALYPVESDYLYFVSHNDGTHEFTRTYNEHLAAVRKYQIDRKAREGKSWRDLKKKTVSNG